jgi:hypothetical protein
LVALHVCTQQLFATHTAAPLHEQTSVFPQLSGRLSPQWFPQGSTGMHGLPASPPSLTAPLSL